MDGYFLLILASLAFVGSHFLMSHPLRQPMVTMFGPRLFQAVYSLVSLATFIWMVTAFRSIVPSGSYWNVGDVHWAVASLLTLFASTLLVGSFAGNPALPSPNADKLVVKVPAGVFLVTRHPMMWAFALWGVAHILIAPRPEIFIMVGSIIFLALAGAKMQESKKITTMGVDWEGWMRRTHYWPQIGGFVKIGVTTWVIGILFWLVATWGHGPLGGFVAGVFRWL